MFLLEFIDFSCNVTSLDKCNKHTMCIKYIYFHTRIYLQHIQIFKNFVGFIFAHLGGFTTFTTNARFG